MMYRMARGVAIVCGMTVALLSTPSESKALFCHLFDGCGLFGSSRTTYRPLFSGLGCCARPACNPCATQTCNYVPQTCYRTECVNVPVTTYRPCQSCDPCTGCPVTTYRPVTSMVRQVRYVPYTTYRPVCTTGCAPVAAPVVAAPAVAAPATSYYPATVAPAAPACCTPTAATLSAPATTYPAIPSAPVIQGTPASPAVPGPALPATPVPSLNGGSSQSYESGKAPQTDLKPIPQNGTSSGTSSGSTPWLNDPHSRTTRLPATEPTADRGNLVVPALYQAPASESKTIDDGGWRAARR